MDIKIIRQIVIWVWLADIILIIYYNIIRWFITYTGI